MKEMKRIISLVLCFVMLVGLVPFGVFAAETSGGSATVVDAAIIFSDLHTSQNVYKESTVKGIMGALKNTGMPFSSVTSAGDAFSVNSGSGYVGYPSTITGYIRDALGNSTIPVHYVWSDHDRCAEGIDKNSGFVYGAGSDGIYGTSDDGNYYIYSLSMADLSTNDRYSAGFSSNAAITATIAKFVEDAAKLDQSKPLFIASHQPLFDRRDDNGHALEWCTAINQVAETMDVAFFFGHNHNYDQAGDYYYAKGSTMAVTKPDYSSQNVKLNFTHMCAGYMAPGSTGSTNSTTRQGVAVGIVIYEDSIRYTTYDANGVYTGNYALDKTVTRDFAVIEKTFEFDWVDVTASAAGASVTNAEVADITDYLVDGYYYAFDVALEDQAANTDMTVKLYLPDVFDVTNLAVYHIDAEGNYTQITDYANGKTDDGVAYVVIEKAAQGIYAYGTPSTDDEIPADAVLDSLTVYGPADTKYFLDQDLTIDGKVYLDITGLTVKANYALDGKTYTKTIEWDYFKDDVDGYSLEMGDMTTAGEKTVTVSYGGKTAQFTVWVCEKQIEDTDAEVKIVFDTPSVVKMDMAVGAPAAAVKAAVAGKLSGNVVAYTFNPTYGNGDTALLGKATVTLPIPEGVTKAAVYYVSDDGAATEKMASVDNGDGTITFTTDHFSIFVVGDTTVDDDDGPESDVTIGGETYEEKTIYVRVNQFENGGKYLVIGENAPSNGSPIAYLNNSGSEGMEVVTINTDSITVGSTTYSDGYIEIDNANAVWTASGSTPSGFTLTNDGHYIGGTGADTLFSSSGSAVRMTYDASDVRLRTASGTTRYLYYSTHNSENWKWATSPNSTTSSRQMWIYKEVTAQIATSSSVTYSMKVETPAAHILSKNADGYTNKLQLEYELLKDGESCTPPAGGNYSFSLSGDAIATVSTTGEVTFNGNVGSAAIKVAYTWTEGEETYTVHKYVPISAVMPEYELRVEAPASGQVKLDSTIKLEATALVNGTAVENANITWKSSDDSIATVASDGTVTGKSLGTVTITATWTDPDGTEHTGDITLDVVESVYVLDLRRPLTDEEGNNVVGDDGKVVTEDITAPIVIKNVTSGQTYSNVWAVIYKDGEDIGTLSPENLEKLTFISSNEDIATVDKTTGKVTFHGATGTTTITAYYEYADGKSVTDAVVFSVSTGSSYVPEDGTDDFPQYPEEGAIRFDKTATGVGNFSQTGITKVELSMTGVPFTENNKLDVVLMLDLSNSMTDTRLSATIAAAKVFVKNVAMNEDGKFNGNRIYIGAFSGGNPAYAGQSRHQFKITDMTVAEDDGFQVVNDQDEMDALFQSIEQKFTKATNPAYGTEYAQSLEACYDLLNACKDDGNKQFAVFMSDGIPNVYQGENTWFDGTTTGTSNNYTPDNGVIDMFAVQNAGNANATVTRDNDYEYERYSTQMKNNGVTVFSVGLGLYGTNSSWSAGSAAACEKVANFLLNDISGPAGETTRDTGSALSKVDEYFFSVKDANAAADMTNVFGAIAQKIMEAAKDVRVTDQMGDNFTMVFEAPNATVSEMLGEKGIDTQFYIEINDYQLNPVYGDDGVTIVDYLRDTENVKSLFKIYMGTDGDSYYAAKDASGTKYETPAFNTTPLGSKLYWTTVEANGDPAIKVTGADGETYYFTAKGNGTHNLVSGAYASGKLSREEIKDDDNLSDTTTDINTTSTDLIIATPYFVYNAATKTMVWTVEKLTTSELAMTYFLYLDKSGGYSGMEGETLAQTYKTNEFAVLMYSNYKGHECEQYFPVPQITWNGAQVTYVFYLVNENGQPVNTAGRVIPFSEAVYVTQPVTYSVVWNDMEQVASLEAAYLAKDHVPEVYELYDANASYSIHVFENEEEQNLDNHFVIGETNKSVKTTYVYNAKSDATKYTEPNVYSATPDYLCKEYEGVSITSSTPVTDEEGNILYYIYEGEYSGSNQYMDAEGNAVYGKDKNGAYTIVSKTGAETVRTGFDFSNTTVAFAVVWKPTLVADTVVVDYGLDVVIDVTTNDALASGVVGVRAEAPAGVAINNGVFTAARNNTADLYIDTDNDNKKELKIGTANVESRTSVRFSMDKANGMQFTDPVTFYYESDANYYQNNDLKTASMYSSVTVIPATTIYYEDDFVTFTSHDNSTGVKKLAEGSSPVSGTWYLDGTVSTNATQAVDRPGEGKISAAYDANNPYGYDGAYANCSKYSLNSAVKVKVDAGSYATADFTFYGTGFDIIGLTSNTSGVLMITVKNAAGDTVATRAVDTYYGYAYSEADGWYSTESTDPNALYQVPVMQVDGLDYGKYSVTLKASYFGVLDHNSNVDGYELYIDAIRTYDPAGKIGTAETVVKDAYVKDKEGWPLYKELRNHVIASADFTTGKIDGLVFIDGADDVASVTDYTSFGPNNELYLAPGQAVVFNLDLESHIDLSKIASVQLGMKCANNTAVKYVIADGSKITSKEHLTNAAATDLKTATDMYYDITGMKDKTVVIYNSGTSGILSLTNIKITFTENPGDLGTLFYVDYDLISKILANMQEESAGVKPDPDQPESGFQPTITVSTQDNVYCGEMVTIEVITSSNVSYITVDGKKVEESTAVDASLKWIYEFKAEESETAYEKYVEVIAYNEAGTASQTVQIQVEVEPYFEPDTFTVTLSKTEAQVGDSVTVNVTTSETVSAVSVNGKIIRSAGIGKWMTKLTMTAEGTETVTVVAYNENGVASEAQTAKITVSGKASTPTTTIQTLVNTILNSLKQWFGWNW